MNEEQECTHIVFLFFFLEKKPYCLTIYKKKSQIMGQCLFQPSNVSYIQIILHSNNIPRFQYEWWQLMISLRSSIRLTIVLDDDQSKRRDVYRHKIPCYMSYCNPHVLILNKILDAIHNTSWYRTTLPESFHSYIPIIQDLSRRYLY
jgi:hypothetical protein